MPGRSRERRFPKAALPMPLFSNPAAMEHRPTLTTFGLIPAGDPRRRRRGATWRALLLVLAVGLPAAHAVEAPDRASLNRALSALEQSADSPKEVTRQRAELEVAIGFVDDEERLRKRIKAREQEARAAPARLVRAEQELANYRPADRAALASNAETRDIAALGRELGDGLAHLENLQGKLADINNQLALAETLPERSQNQLTKLFKRLDDLRGQLERTETTDKADSAQLRMAAEVAMLTSSIDLQQLELQSSQQLQALAVAQRELLIRRIGDQQLLLDVLQQTLHRKRRERIEKSLAEAAVANSGLPNSALLAAQQQENRQLGTRLLEIADRGGNLLKESIVVKTQLEQARQTARILEDQINALAGSLLLSEILHEQYRALPSARVGASLADEIADLRLEQFRLTRQREALANPTRYIDQLLAEVPLDEQFAGLRDALATTIAIRQELLGQLDGELQRLFNLGIMVQVSQDQLLTTSAAVRSTIEERMFWIPSTRGLSATWLGTLPSTLYAQVTSLSPALVRGALGNLAPRYWGLYGLPVLLAGALLWLRPRLHRRLDRLHGEIGQLRKDSQRHTPFAILLCLLLSLPGPLLLTGAAALVRIGSPAITPTSAALLKLALLWLVIGLCRHLLHTRGIAGRHLNWPAPAVRALRRMITSIGLVLVPLTLVIAIGEHSPDPLAEDRLGQLVVLIASPLLAFLIARASLVYPHETPNRLVRIGVALTLGSLLLIPAVLTALGYYYTAIKLGGRLSDSFFLLILWVLSAAAAMRGLAVAARRLTYRRAVAMREAMREAAQSQREGAEVVEVVEEPPLDMDQVSSQSLRLTRLLLVLGFGVIFYWVWADMLSAFAYTDTIALWEQNVAEGDRTHVEVTSLGDLLIAAAVAMVTLVLARNLPGLLEVTVLSRLEVAAGSAYAITSLLSYAITAVGLLTALSLLGVPWNRLQWLVAALGVGLGFGLQEIFANFVSGLIILFERPVRIGDVITIGDLTGSVSRIRIRATTITDFDRKEIIVPNKNFVTDRLINWTLTDSVTRIMIKVGFAYGTDLATARQLLMDAAAANPRIMADPAPVVYFLAFGASTLDHELRVHVRELADRLPAIDELNRAIDERCRALGIQIAFNQMDIRIRRDPVPRRAERAADGTAPTPLPPSP